MKKLIFLLVLFFTSPLYAQSTITVIDYMIVGATEFVEPAAMSSTKNDFCPYTHSGLVTENQTQLYSADRELFLTVHDADSQETVMIAQVDFPPDLTGIHSTSGLKVRWVAVITSPVAATSDQIRFEIWGRCFGHRKNLNTAPFTPEWGHIEIPLTVSAEKNVLVVSPWMSIGSNTIIDLGKNPFCQIAYLREVNHSQPPYNQPVGFVQWEFQFQRKMRITEIKLDGTFQ